MTTITYLVLKASQQKTSAIWIFYILLCWW